MSTFDRLPARAAAIRRVEGRLIEHFAACGYAEVIVPMVEDADVYVAPDAPRLVQGDRVLSLRGDFTGPLARMVSTRLGELNEPIRLAYRGIVFRGARQTWQAGCEAFGVEGVEADAAVIRMALGALGALGIEEARAVVGSVACVEAAHPGASGDHALRDALDRRDRMALAAHPALAALLHWNDTVSRVQNGDTYQVSTDTDRIHPVLVALAHALSDSALAIDFDPAHVRRFPYYTGMVFDLFAPGFARPVGGGGRYDGLCARYGRPRPAVGFSLDVELLAQGDVELLAQGMG